MIAKLCSWVALALFLFQRISVAQDAICVRVKIEIDQELTLERQGFEARMNINNGGPVDLENLNVVMNFFDQDNNPVVATSDPNNTTAKFFLRLTSSATLPNRVAGSAEEKLRWLIVPAPSSAGTDPNGSVYFVGAKLTYSSGGIDSAINVSPDSIRVKPMPLLLLDYFLPYDVYGDDPFTTKIEPPIPFSLGVRVRNNGFGSAHNVQIESGQPKIVENKQGLQIDFKILGSEVNGNPATPSLLTNFGDIGSNRSGVARWIMTTSLYGRFVDFSATFTHADELGGKLTSLITDVKTHRLIRDVLVDLPGRDGIRDFLALDGETLNVYESENNDAQVADLSGDAALSAIPQGQRVSVPGSAGFSYTKLTDPYSGMMEIKSAVRSDGRTVNLSNAWLSSTFLPDVRQWKYYLNIFDTNNVNGASYDLTFGHPGGGNRAPVLRRPSDRITRVSNMVGFLVEASDPDGDPVTVTATSLPVGATFTANPQGVMVFSWMPGSDQTGNFPVQFVASDGRLTDTKSTTITVTAGSLLKDWKNHYWPGVSDPAIIGNNVDFDGDELSTLIEYALGLDPTDASLEGAPEIGTVEFWGQPYLSLTYIRRTDDPNLQFAVVASDSTRTPEADWQVVSNTVPADQAGVSDGFQKVIIRDEFPIDGTRQKRFLRLRVTTTESE